MVTRVQGIRFVRNFSYLFVRVKPHYCFQSLYMTRSAPVLSKGSEECGEGRLFCFHSRTSVEVTLNELSVLSPHSTTRRSHTETIAVPYRVRNRVLFSFSLLAKFQLNVACEVDNCNQTKKCDVPLVSKDGRKQGAHKRSTKK